MNFPAPLYSAADNHPFPLLFATVSGAHLYGFPSPDSDYDLRGVHILPVKAIVGLDSGEETIQSSKMTEGIELDLVTHDIKKFFSMLLKKNGYVLEQLYSPLIIRTGEDHAELKGIAIGCITRHHSHHYLGFAETQWNLFLKETPHRVKPLLYVYRVLLTGIHLMRTGVIEANLVELNTEMNLPFIPELIASKTTTGEHETLPSPDLQFHQAEYLRLRQELEQASATSNLQESPSARPALDDLLRRIRMQHL